MISMTKQEMVRYLNDYAQIMYIATHNPEKSIGIIFNNYMQSQGRYNDDNREYYNRMINVYTSYIQFKKFSMIEDFLLNRDDYISNNDLSGLEEDLNIIEAPGDLTNKRIVQLIRNAFNHNDNSYFDRFKMSKNGRYFEIKFKDIRTPKEIENGLPEKPVTLKFNQEYLKKIENMISKERKNIYIISFDIPKDFDMSSSNLDTELDKISLVKYHFQSKISKETLSEFERIIDVKDLPGEELLRRSEELHNNAKEISYPDKFPLTSIQKEKVKSIIERYKKHYPLLLETGGYAIIYYILSRVIPIPAYKDKLFKNQIILSYGYFCDVNLSVNEVLKRVARVINNEEIPEDYDEIDTMIHNELLKNTKSDQLSIFNDYLDGEILSAIPIIMYIDSVITHCCTAEEITIDGVTYSKEKLRNSFTHARWFISKDEELIMYDADPRNINLYNLEFVGKIKIESFYLWALNYMSEYNKNNNHSK